MSLKKIADDQKSILAEAKNEASQLVAEAKKTAEEFKRKIEASAIVEKGQILDSAKAEISNLKDQAIQELKSTVVDLAIGATEKLLDEKLDSENSKALVNKYIEKVEA
jgi:F-type H+-transporting ATPase subunit b